MSLFVIRRTDPSGSGDPEIFGPDAEAKAQRFIQIGRDVKNSSLKASVYCNVWTGSIDRVIEKYGRPQATGELVYAYGQIGFQVRDDSRMIWRVWYGGFGVHGQGRVRSIAAVDVTEPVQFPNKK